MNLVMIPAATYIWMLAIYLLTALQLILIAWAINKLNRRVTDAHLQAVQAFRQTVSLGPQLASIYTEVQKGNKDQQEIKTKLTNLKQNVQIVKEKAFPKIIVSGPAKPTKTVQSPTKKAKINKRG